MPCAARGVEATLFGATTAVALATDLSSGLVDRFRSLPIARSAVLVARTLADFCRTIGVVAIVIAAGYVVGFRFPNGAAAALAAIGLVLAFAYAYSWLLAVIGLAVRDAETAQLVSTLPILVFIFASSLAVPVDTMRHHQRRPRPHPGRPRVALGLAVPGLDRSPSDRPRPRCHGPVPTPLTARGAPLTCQG